MRLDYFIHNSMPAQIQCDVCGDAFRVTACINDDYMDNDRRVGVCDTRGDDPIDYCIDCWHEVREQEQED